MAGEDLWNIQHRILELCRRVIGMVGETYLHQSQNSETESMSTEVGLIVNDVTAFFQAFESTPARCFTQRKLFGHFGVRYAPIICDRGNGNSIVVGLKDLCIKLFIACAPLTKVEIKGDCVCRLLLAHLLKYSSVLVIQDGTNGRRQFSQGDWFHEHFPDTCVHKSGRIET